MNERYRIELDTLLTAIDRVALSDSEYQEARRNPNISGPSRLDSIKAELRLPSYTFYERMQIIKERSDLSHFEVTLIRLKFLSEVFLYFSSPTFPLIYAMGVLLFVAITGGSATAAT